MSIVVLAGGVGAARFLEGLVRVVSPADITVIVNTGDDMADFFGLYISPDLDIVTYTLAGIVNSKQGWGIRGDTFRCLEMLKDLGCETWFALGDRDLGTHLARTAMLKQGWPLSKVTETIARALGVRCRLLPMTDQWVPTRVSTPVGWLHFQEYLVKRGARDAVEGVRFEGVEQTVPAPGVLETIRRAKTLVVAPSNPIVSIGPILAVPGIRSALAEAMAPCVAVSPIVAGRPVKGPADKFMAAVGVEVSPRGVAQLYKDFLDVLVIDEQDQSQAAAIGVMGVRAVAEQTLMTSLVRKTALARAVLNAAKAVKSVRR
jgi:LPPG:FO 2-phospho-L-lactate transferase